MATKSQVRIEYDPEQVVGKAEFDAKQQENLQYSGTVRLRTDLTYVILKQWVHSANLLRPIKGNDKSKKLFILGLNKATHKVETVLTLSMNGFLQQFYDYVKENPELLITAVKNSDQLWRAISGTVQTSVWMKGGLPIRTKDKNAYIPYDIAFELVGRESVYTGQLVPKAGKWDMMTRTIEGRTYLDLAKQNMNLFSEVELPEFDIEEVGEKVLSQIQSYQEGLPEN